MRLIDVDAFKEYMNIPEPDEDGNFTEEQEIFLYGIVIFMSELAMELDCAPTAAAVPIDRLAAWLSENAKLEDEKLDAAAWEEKITRWAEKEEILDEAY